MYSYNSRNKSHNKSLLQKENGQSKQNIQFKDNSPQSIKNKCIIDKIAIQRKIGFEFEVPRKEMHISLTDMTDKTNYEESQIGIIGDNIKLTLDNAAQKDKTSPYTYSAEFVNIAPYDETKDLHKAVTDWSQVVSFIQQINTQKRVPTMPVEVPLKNIDKPVYYHTFEYQTVTDNEEEETSLPQIEKPFSIIIKNHDITGNPQSTQGVPLQSIPLLIKELTRSQTPLGYGGTATAKKEAKAVKYNPAIFRERKALSDSFARFATNPPQAQGFLGLVKSYIEVHRQALATIKNTHYAKFLLPVMSRTDFKHLFSILGQPSQDIVRGILREYIEGRTTLFTVPPASPLFSVKITKKDYSGESLNALTIQDWLISIIGDDRDALIALQEPGISEINSDDEDDEMLQKYHMSSPTDIGYDPDLQGAVLELRALRRRVPLTEWPKLVENSIRILNSILPKATSKSKSSALPPIKMASKPSILPKTTTSVSNVPAVKLPPISIPTKTITTKVTGTKPVTTGPLPILDTIPKPLDAGQEIIYNRITKSIQNKQLPDTDKPKLYTEILFLLREGTNLSKNLRTFILTMKSSDRSPFFLHFGKTNDIAIAIKQILGL